MQVHRNSATLPSFKNAVITIGTFDGVHVGHQQIIEQLKNECIRVQGESVIITFDPHPRKVIQAASGIKLINTLGEKIELLAEKGIDHLVVVPFTEEFSKLTAEQYVSEFLVAKFHPHTIIIGYDHRFGSGRKGDYHLLENLSDKYQYKLLELPVQVLHAVSVSSTRIREAVAKSDIATANELLGYSFFFEGKVIQGDQMGRKLGFPTANLKIEDEEKLLPGDGVYAVDVEIRHDLEHENSVGFSKRLHGMMNIGFRPTLNGTRRMLEVNIFEFDQSIYGKHIRVFTKRFLRAEQKFSGLDALKAQLALDKKAAQE